MKLLFTTTILVSVLGLVAADVPKPQITLGVRNSGLGKFGDGGLGGLEPAIKWQTEGSTESFDWEAGLDIQVEDLNSMPPYSHWGKIKRKVQGFALSARGVTDSKTPETIDLDFRADGPSTSLQVTGKFAATSYSIGKLNIKQSISLPAGRITVSPRYNVGTNKADVGVGYAVGSTSINVESSNKKLTVAQLVGDRNVIIPSITTEGKVELSLQRKFDGFGKITTSIKPAEAINIKWEEGSYVANIHAPIDGFSIDKVDVSIKRRVDL